VTPCGSGDFPYRFAMSADEIIEQIKALPKEEFLLVAAFFDEACRGDDSMSESKKQIRPGFHEAAREVFDRYDGLFRELEK
jgi:hypothetical protein